MMTVILAFSFALAVGWGIYELGYAKGHFNGWYESKTKARWHIWNELGNMEDQLNPEIYIRIADKLTKAMDYVYKFEDE